MADLYPFQKQLLIDIESGGCKPGEMRVMMSGRQAGKSSIAAFHRLWSDVMGTRVRPIEDLVLDEGKVFGARYLTVEPIGGHWPDMEAWARASFGEPAEIWEAQDFIWPDCGRWYMNDRKFWFREAKDRDWFILRWRT